MSVHIDVTRTSDGVVIQCNNKNWSQKWFPLDGIPIKPYLCKKREEEALDDLYLEIQAINTNNAFVLSKESNNVVHFDLGTPKPWPSIQIKCCFERIFDIGKINQLIPAIPKEAMLQKLSSVQDSETLLKELDIIARENLKTEIVNKYGMKAYEFLRRVSPKELISLLNKVKSIENTEEDLKCLKSASWDHSFFNDLDLSFKVVKAFLEGHIDLVRVSNILVFIACRKRVNNPSNHKEYVFQLIDKSGNFDQSAVSLLSKGLEKYLSLEEINRFIESIKTLAPEDTQFYKVPCKIDMDLENIKMKIREGWQIGFPKVSIIEYFYHVNEFRMNLVKSEEKKLELNILPPHLQYLLLKAKFGDLTMQPNPVLGPSDTKDFENPNQRDVFLPSSELMIFAPDIADNYKVEDEIFFLYHDLVYHLFAESANGHRLAWIELAQFYHARQKDTIWQFLVDRDFGIYNILALDFENFMKASHNQPNTASDLKVAQWLKNVSSGELFWIVLASIKRFRVDSLAEKDQWRFFSLAIEYIDKHQDQWKENYRICFDDLENIYKKIKEDPNFDQSSELGKFIFSSIDELKNAYQSYLLE